MVPRHTLINLLESIGYKCVIIDGAARQFRHDKTMNFVYVPHNDDLSAATVRRILGRSLLTPDQIERFIRNHRQ